MDGRLRRLWESASRVFLTVLVVVLLAAAGWSLFVAGDSPDSQILDTRLQRANVEIERMERQNRRLRHAIASLRESDELLEKFAREDGGYIKQNEILYFFKNELR